MRWNPSIRSAARSSTWRSSMSATIRATRSHSTDSSASSRVATTPSMATADLPRRWAWPGLAVVIAGGAGLRLWGLRQGLPYVFNTDEGDHFVPHAVAMFGHSLTPHYFANPPAFTYVLHFLFAIAYGGTAGVRHAYALHPDHLYALARATAAALGPIAIGCLYATGARLFSRTVGLLAAALEAVAFLPVFYSHLALNDVPTLAPLTASVLGTAGVLRFGRKRDYALAGAGLGLACASKYTAGIALVPLLAAVTARLARARSSPAGNPAAAGTAASALAGLCLSGAIALAAFVIANPYALLDFDSFHAELAHQSALSSEAQGKLGAPRHGGLLYYMWSLTWGLGWLPSLAALGGACTVWFAGRARSRRRPAPEVGRHAAAGGGPQRGGASGTSGVELGLLLVPAPLLFLAFMGAQRRYFGRWLLPIFPSLCLLAAFFIAFAGEGLARRSQLALVALRARRRRVPATPEPRARAPRAIVAAAVALLAAGALAQGVLYSVHAGLVLSRPDTRNIARAWMLAHIPARTRIVVEPIAPDDWAREGPAAGSRSRRLRRLKYPSMRPRITRAGTLAPAAVRVGIEEYERTLSPALIGYYTRHSYCWLISGSTQSGRAFADPAAVPLAIAYYRALWRYAQLAYGVSPYFRGRAAVAFGFDWSFDYYPLAYARPGPEVRVYRLHGARCGL